MLLHAPSKICIKIEFYCKFWITAVDYGTVNPKMKHGDVMHFCQNFIKTRHSEAYGQARLKGL